MNASSSTLQYRMISYLVIRPLPLVYTGQSQREPASPDTVSPENPAAAGSGSRLRRIWKRCDDRLSCARRIQARQVVTAGLRIGCLHPPFLEEPAGELACAHKHYRRCQAQRGHRGGGAPRIQRKKDGVGYLDGTHHSNADTYDRVQKADVMQSSMIEAWFVYNAPPAQICSLTSRPRLLTPMRRATNRRGSIHAAWQNLSTD